MCRVHLPGSNLTRVPSHAFLSTVDDHAFRLVKDRHVCILASRRLTDGRLDEYETEAKTLDTHETSFVSS